MDTNLSITIPTDPSDEETHRSAEEMARDMAIEARLYVRGSSLTQIRDAVSELYPNRPQFPLSDISKDIDKIHKAWLNSSLLDFSLAKAKELAKLDALEEQAWDAWERSKAKHIKIEYEEADDQVAFAVDQLANVKRKKKRKIIEATVGDIRYLNMVQESIEARCRILGLFDATKLQVDWRIEAAAVGLGEAEMEAVKQKTVDMLLATIEQAAADSGIRQEDILDGEFEE